MKGILFIFIALLQGSLLFSQDKFPNALDSFHQFEGPEKIYMIYDRQEYVAGETIWFSAFIFSRCRLSKISTNFFVEFYDRKKKLIVQKRFPIFEGRSGGQLRLPTSLGEDVYFMRAYTSWMRNFSEDFQYVHPITVFNPRSVQRLEPVVLHWQATAVPEGGNLVDRVPTRVSIRLQSGSPLPHNWQGCIVEKETRKTLATAEYLDPNVALAVFTPRAGHHYEAVVQDMQGNETRLDLPDVLASGIHLEVATAVDSIGYKVRIRESRAPSIFTVVGTMNGETLYQAHIKSFDTIFSGNIPTSTLLTGVLRVSVLDTGDRVVAQRACFVRHSPPGLVKTATYVDTDSRSGFTTLRFNADTAAEPFLVAVLNASAKNSVEGNNLLSSMWLEGEVSGLIENSARYFQPGDFSADKALDALLMGEKCRSLSWDVVPLCQYDENNPPDDYISLKGLLPRNHKWVTGQSLTLIFHSSFSPMSIIQVIPDSNGTFFLHHLLFYDSVTVSYQLNEGAKPSHKLSINFETTTNPFPFDQSFPEVPFTLVARTVGESIPDAILKRLNTIKNDSVYNNRYKIMQNVNVAAKTKSKKELLEQELSSKAFTGSNEAIFDFVNEDQHADSYQNILDWLPGKVGGLEIKDDGYGNKMPFIRQSPVAVYLNELPVDPQYIDQIKVTEIAMIKVIKGYFVGGFGAGGGGGVLIYTKKPLIETQPAASQMKSVVIRGYDVFDQFPSENQDTTSAPEFSRDVLFWNPFTVLGHDGSAEVKFHTNHQEQGYKIIIAGITEAGEPWFYSGAEKVPVL